MFFQWGVFWASGIGKSHKGQDLANKEGVEARQTFPVSDIRVQWPLCFIKYLFHLYTKNTVVLDIFGRERRPFPNHFSFSVYRAIVNARLNGFTHVLYQWRAYTTIYTIHVPISCKSWLKARYWPSCIHIWTPLIYPLVQNSRLPKQILLVLISFHISN